jgi:hypothetical protein
MVSQRVAGVPERVSGGIIPPEISHPVVATGEPEGWEIIFCAYTMISLNSPAFLALNQFGQSQPQVKEKTAVDFSNHQLWNHDSGWKNTLNNLRLIIQPLLLFWSIYPWLTIFLNSDLFLVFNHLINTMNQFKLFYASG